MHRYILVCFVVGWVFAIAGAQPPDKVTLRLHYQPGQTLVYEVDVDGKITVISEIGVATDLQFRGTLRQEQQVESVAEDGTAAVLITVNGTLRVDMGGNPAPGTPTAQQSNETTIPQTKLRMKIAPNGRVLEMQPVPSDKASDGGKATPPPMLQDPFQALTLGSGAISLLPVLLPDKPVKVGDSWDLTGTAQLPLPGGRSVPIAIKGMGKLAAVQTANDRPVAVADVRIEAPELGDAIVKVLPLKEMGIDMQAKGGTTTNGKHWFDLASGVLTRSEVTAETQLSTLIRMPENVGGSVLTLQSRTTLKTTARLVEVRAPSKR